MQDRQESLRMRVESSQFIVLQRMFQSNSQAKSNNDNEISGFAVSMT